MKITRTTTKSGKKEKDMIERKEKYVGVNQKRGTEWKEPKTRTKEYHYIKISIKNP